MAARIGVGMLGCGFIGTFHSYTLRNLPYVQHKPTLETDLVVIADVDARARGECKARFGWAEEQADWQSLVADPRIDLFINAAPNDLHAEPTVAAATNGKHVFCEKPLGRTGDEAFSLWQAVAATGVIHQCAFSTRFIPALRYARELIKSGELGEVLQFRSAALMSTNLEPEQPMSWRLDKRVAGFGALGDLGSHYIDLGRYLIGEISEVAGKSTTLRMLSGLEEVSEGEVHIGERRVTNDPPRHRDIAMVFQSYALYPHMTAYGNLAFSLKNRGLPRDEIERRVRAAAEVLDIVELLDRRPRKLSGGERQRVALGRAIVREPQVFLMDEPLSNLDAQLRVSTRAELVKLHHRLQTTFVYVTHDQVEAMTMGTRIAVLRGGVLEQVDTAEGLYERPTNLFVASFIGSPPMNLIPATVRTEEDAIQIEAAGLHFALPVAGQQIKTLGGRQAVLGIRPEHIDLVDAAPAGRVVMAAEVSYVEPMGGEALLGLIVGERELVARVREHRGRRVGERISIGIETKRVYLFDGTSEELVLAPSL